MATKPTYEGLEQRVKELEKKAGEGERAEEKLRHGKREWEDTFDAMSDWVSVTDLEARIVQSNQAGEKFTGVPLAEIVGQTCCKLVHGTDAPIPGCPLQKMLRTHHRETAELRLPDGDQWLIVTVDPVKDMDGNLVGAVHIAHDITERKRMEETLRESEERYRIIIESIEDGYYEVDIAGNFTFFNDSLCEIMGYTRDELMGMNNRHYYEQPTLYGWRNRKKSVSVI